MRFCLGVEPIELTETFDVCACECACACVSVRVHAPWIVKGEGCVEKCRMRQQEKSRVTSIFWFEQ